MASRTTFICGFMAAALLAGCTAGNSGGTGGAGGQAGSGGGGAGGTGGASSTGGTGGSAPGALPDYKTTVAAGKIQNRTFTFVTGFVSPVASDPSSMQVEMLGFSPELGSTPCWNKPPAGTNRDTELSVFFLVPKAGGSFEWGGGKTISGAMTVTLLSVNSDGTPRAAPSDRAKVTIGAMPTQANAEVAGSLVIQADASNNVNGTFSVRRCDR